LYDKVGLYDAIRRLTTNDNAATTWGINQVWNRDCKDIDKHMLRFMENHDEQRIASAAFAGNPWLAVPGMIVTATLNTGPIMIYSGQEVGEPAIGSQGFSVDSRTSIFDYCGVPEYQKWLNNGNFDGGQLSADQKNLRNFYSKLLNITLNNEALRDGEFYELMLANEYQPGFNQGLYFYLRYTNNQRILVVTNFNRERCQFTVLFPADLIGKLNLNGPLQFKDLLSDANYSTTNITDGINITIPATGGLLLEMV